MRRARSCLAEQFFDVLCVCDLSLLVQSVPWPVFLGSPLASLLSTGACPVCGGFQRLRDAKQCEVMHRRDGGHRDGDSLDLGLFDASAKHLLVHRGRSGSQKVGGIGAVWTSKRTNFRTFFLERPTVL